MVVITALQSHREINESVCCRTILSKCQRSAVYFSFVYFPTSYRGPASSSPAIAELDERGISVERMNNNVVIKIFPGQKWWKRNKLLSERILSRSYFRSADTRPDSQCAISHYMFQRTLRRMYARYPFRIL